MRCPECGSPVHPNWDSCRGCGAALEGLKGRPAGWVLPTMPRPVTEGAKRAVERVRNIQGPSFSTPRLALRALPRSSRLGGGAGSLGRALSASRAQFAMPAMSGARRFVAPAAVFVAVAALLFAAVFAAAAADARAEARQAREAEQAVGAKLTELQSAVAGAEQTRGALQSAAQTAQASASSVAAERDAANQRLDAAAKDLAELQAKLTSVTATAEQQTALAGQQKQQVRVLTECLSGTLVAVEFGRSGRWSSADRALDAVKDSCTAARALL